MSLTLQDKVEVSPTDSLVVVEGNSMNVGAEEPHVTMKVGEETQKVRVNIKEGGHTIQRGNGRMNIKGANHTTLKAVLASLGRTSRKTLQIPKGSATQRSASLSETKILSTKPKSLKKLLRGPR
jgi:hypothetical protein